MKIAECRPFLALLLHAASVALSRDQGWAGLTRQYGLIRGFEVWGGGMKRPKRREICYQ